MAITVAEKYEDRSTKIGLYLKRDHVRRFVATTTASEGSYAVSIAAGVPSLGAAHPEDAAALCTDIDAKQTSGTSNVWMITCKYTNDLPDDTFDDDDPLSVRSKSAWSADDYSRFVDQDRDGNPILNSAGDKYDEPIEMIDSLPVLTIVKNRLSFSASQAYAYNNATNSDTFKGADPGTLRVKITASEEWKSDSAYWAVNYTFRYNPNGWQPQILEAGLYQKVNNSRVPCFIKGEATHDSEPVTEAVPLDAAGAQIDPTTLSDTPSPVVYTTWNVLPELPYASLGV